MSRFGSNRDVQDVFQVFLGGIARFLLTVGAIALVGGVGMILFTIVRTGSDTTIPEADALRNIALFGQVVVVGAIAVAVGSTFLFWGEEVLGALQLMGAAALYFAPMYAPGLLGVQPRGEILGRGMGEIQAGGAALGMIAILVLVADLIQRARDRVKQGARAEQLKIGKGIKEEQDRQNVFMGKCWQLPFCRKFVRDLCPIYHAKTTCWREGVGCMCEESVIRNAMAGSAIPKDALLAAKYIPRNNKLTQAQKKERCRSCVIYNEHLRHIYKLALPSVLLGFVAVYFALRQPLLAAAGSMVNSVNQLISKGTLGAAGQMAAPPAFVELLLVCMFLVALSYTLKILEFSIFRLKG